MDAATYLQDWTHTFLKHRNLMMRHIESMEMKEGWIAVRTKEGEERHVIDPSLDKIAETIDAANKDKDTRYVVVCLNNKANVDKTIEQWKELACVAGLSMMFVNPFSEPDKKWIIRPMVHDKITDSESLGMGLNSLAEGVTPITQEQLEERIRK